MKSSTRLCSALVVSALCSSPALAQRTPTPLPRDVTSAAVTGVQIDPATQVDPARQPGDLGRRSLEPLGLTSEQLNRERAAVYSADRLGDDAGELAVFGASVVKQNGRWVFWSADLPTSVQPSRGETQVSFVAERGVRYLVDFALDSAEQDFAVVSGEKRTTEAPAFGHIALVVDGTGKRQKVRIVPLGDSQYAARRYTLFSVTVTPIE
jgi:hypothetical protein